MAAEPHIEGQADHRQAERTLAVVAVDSPVDTAVEDSRPAVVVDIAEEDTQLVPVAGLDREEEDL